VLGVWVHDYQIISYPTEFVNFARCINYLANAVDGEIGIVQRSIDEYGPGRNGREYFVKIERHPVRITAVDLANPRHVPIAGPPGQITVIVFGEGCESTACHHRPQPLIETGDE